MSSANVSRARGSNNSLQPQSRNQLDNNNDQRYSINMPSQNQIGSMTEINFENSENKVYNQWIWQSIFGIFCIWCICSVFILSILHPSYIHYSIPPGIYILYQIVVVYKLRKSMQKTYTEEEAGQKKMRQYEFGENILLLILGILAIIKFAYKEFMPYYLLPFLLLCVYLRYKIYQISTLNGDCIYIWDFGMIGFRCFYCVQFFSIALKIDDIVDWKWKEIFWPFWVFFAICVGIVFAILLMVISKFCQFCQKEIQSYELKGIIWMFIVITVHTGMICIIVMGLVEQLDNDDSKFLIQSLLGNSAVTSLMIIVTIFLRRDIKLFMKLVITEEQVLQQEQFMARQTQQNRVAQEMESPKNYVFSDIPRFLAKKSETYFKKIEVPLIREKSKSEHNKDKKVMKFSLSNYLSDKEIQKDKDNDKNSKKKNKKEKKKKSTKTAVPSSTDNNSVQQFPIEQIQARRIKSKINTLIQQQHAQSTSEIKIDDKRGSCPNIIKGKNGSSQENYKENNKAQQIPQALQQPTSAAFLNTVNNNNSIMDYVTINDGQETIITNNQLKTFNEIRESKESVGQDKVIEKGLNQLSEFQKAHLSMLNSDILRKNENSMSRKKMETAECVSERFIPKGDVKEEIREKKESLKCLICFERSQNAVFLSCYHGGICYECARETCNQTEKCYLCREPISEILQIDQAKNSDYYKVVSVTKLVEYEGSSNSYENNF